MAPPPARWWWFPIASSTSWSEAAGEVKAPVSGTVVETNESLVDDPGQVNTDAQGEGWFIKLKLTEPGQLDGLMDEDAYNEFVSQL